MYFISTAVLLCLSLHIIRASSFNKPTKIWHLFTCMLTLVTSLSLAIWLKIPLLTPFVLGLDCVRRLMARSLIQRRENALHIEMLKAYALQQRLAKRPPISAIRPQITVLKDDNLKKAS